MRQALQRALFFGRPAQQNRGRPVLFSAAVLLFPRIAMTQKPLYRIQFVNQGRIYELYARHVAHGAMLGFVDIGDFVFGKRTEVVVDPSEEKLKAEFEGVKRSFIPVHAVIRVDEVAKSGVAKISKAEGNVTPFPMNYFPPDSK